MRRRHGQPGKLGGARPRELLTASRAWRSLPRYRPEHLERDAVMRHRVTYGQGRLPHAHHEPDGLAHGALSRLVRGFPADDVAARKLPHAGPAWRAGLRLHDQHPFTPKD